MRVTLIHNATAGNADQGAETLVELLREHGHSVHYRSSKDPTLAQALTWPADLIAAAGGDGTVSKVLKQLPEDAPPVAILPLGTANNIAMSLGIRGACEDLVPGWTEGRVGRFDIGSVESSDGTRSVVEGIGIGAFAAAMRTLDDISGPTETQLETALKTITKAMKRKKPRSIEIEVDGKSAVLDVLFAEITNISRIGPKINLVPWAEPGDGKIEVVYALEEQREAMVEWLTHADWGIRPPVECLRGEQVTILRAHKRLRVDDDLDVSISALPLTLEMGRTHARMLLPQLAGPDA